ncbi:hypothetical protein AVEN_91071-1 [Araneus ventricosus]|uniref:C2HC/C3H-type domain-containing protein n=1 Tax=Araneus ventricosus TaxID=182803 RepID=A0A4Y2J7U9_ARAVE|nr:hypothetical protein AVEN_91071-1 [Araneus ventricosus]
MTSEAPYLHCRLCGVRYRSDKVVEHERHCSYQNSNSRSSSRNVKEDLVPVSSKDSGINELRDKEEYYMQATRSSQSSVNKPKDLKSNEESIDSPLNLMNRGVERESRECHDEPTESHSRSEPTAWEIPSTDGPSTSGQSKGRSPPNLSSTSGEKSEQHQRSHSNENTPVKANSENKCKEKASPQKSDEEQKEAMLRTPYPSEEDIKIPPINAEEVGEAADILENLPELNKHAEMAYERHQKSLVPCTHCERTFRPDRLPIHERSCIERPKAREYIVPEDKDKKNLN